VRIRPLWMTPSSSGVVDDAEKVKASVSAGCRQEGHSARKTNGVGTNFGVVSRRGKARRAESGGWGCWEGTASPSPSTRGFAGGSFSGVRGGAPGADSEPSDCLPSISVGIAYSLHGFYRFL